LAITAGNDIKAIPAALGGSKPKASGNEPPARKVRTTYKTPWARPRKVADGEHIATAKRMKADGHTGKDIAKYLGVSRATMYRYLDEDVA
jgi:DNA invertase Pin-like site-specific DNA recombinase